MNTNTLTISRKVTNKSLMERADRLNQMLYERDINMKVSYIQCWKNNLYIDGLNIMTPGHNAAPTLYYSPAMDRISDEMLLDELLYMAQERTTDVDDGLILSRDYILSHVKPRLIGEQNKSAVSEQHYVSMPYLDMLIIFVVEIEQMSDNEGLATYTLTDYHIDMANIDIKELFVAAVRNIESDTQIINMFAFLRQQHVLGDIDAAPEDQKMFIVTNSKKISGASCILAPSTLKELERRIGGDIVLIPSSVHEMLAMPKDDRIIKGITDMIDTVNATLKPEEVLNGSLYASHNGEMYQIG